MTLFRLRLLSWLGWGRHPNELRTRGALFLFLFRAAIPVLVVILAMAVVATSWYRGRLHWPPSAASVRFAAMMDSLYLVLFVATLLLPSVSSWWFARRGASSSLSTVYGRCFATLIDPPGSFFARIGLIPETARWYSLPLDWDGVVVPSEVQLELTVLNGTGWVEHLRCPGASPGELSQPMPELLTPAEVAASRAQPTGNSGHIADEAVTELGDEGATKEERQAMRRFARRANLGWRSSPRDLAYGGWAGVVTGAFSLLVPLGFIAYMVFMTPRLWAQMLMSPGAPQALIFVVSLFGSLGLAAMISGLYSLRAWRRYRRFSREPPATVDGEVLAWMAYRDLWMPADWQQRKETLISLSMPDGQSHVFRIPIRYVHRVRRRGAHVRITHVPATERVLDVIRRDAPTR